jgi:hypothetical protein
MTLSQIDSLHHNDDDDEDFHHTAKTSIVFGANGGGDNDGISVIGDFEEEEATGTEGSQTLDAGSRYSGSGGCFHYLQCVGQPLGFLRLSVVVILMTTAVTIVSVVAYLSVHAERHKMNVQYENLSGLVLGTYYYTKSGGWLVMYVQPVR